MPYYLIGKINIVNMAVYRFKANYRSNLYQNINGIFYRLKKEKKVCMETENVLIYKRTLRNKNLVGEIKIPDVRL